MKYVAFLMPDSAWDGYDWLYNLIEERKSDYYDFFLVEAKNAEKAREIALNEFYKKDFCGYGIDGIVEDAYKGFCALEYENEELHQHFGEKDGTIIIALYEKYGWEAFYDDKIHFYETLTKEERTMFCSFDIKNLENLYKKARKYDVLIMPITKQLK